MSSNYKLVASKEFELWKNSRNIIQEKTVHDDQ